MADIITTPAGLVDQWGFPIKPSNLMVEQAGPALGSVRSIISGHPADGLTPQRLGMILREAEAGNVISYLELAEQMEERDGHYLGVISKRKRSIAQLDLTVEEASGVSGSKAHADLLTTFIDRLELQDELFDIMDAIGKGYSVTEILWDTSEAQWMPKRLELRDPRWFRPSLIDGKTMHMLTNVGYRLPPPYQFITHFGKVKSGLPIRGGLARAAAWSYLFKNFDLKSWVSFAEVYGQPIRVGKYGPGASDTDKAVLLRALRNISTDCAAIIPESMMIEFIEAKMTGSVELYEKLANYLDQQISKAVLGNTATTDAIAGGHAVGRTHQAGQQDIERSDAKALEVTLNRDLAKPLIDLNFGPQKSYPIVRIVIKDEQDIVQLATALGPMIDRGLKVGQSQIRALMGLAEPDPGDDLLTPAGAGAPPDGPGDPTPGEGDAGLLPKSDKGDGGEGAATAANARQAPGRPSQPQDSIDALVQEQLGAWQEFVVPILEPVQLLLTSCTSYQEFLSKLPSVVPRQDASALTEALARSMFAARLAAETETDIGSGEVRHG